MQVSPPARRSNLAVLATFTLILGAATLFALTIGRSIALLAMMSIVGIPLAFVLAAIPTIFLVVLLTLIAANLLRVETPLKIGLSALVALAVMTTIPQLHNRLGESRVQTLVAGDRQSPLEPFDKGTLALVMSRPETVWCDMLCQRILARGFAQKFLVLPFQNDPETLDPHAHGTAYHLEQTLPCKRRNPPTSDPAFRAMLASGYCLVDEPATLNQAETLVWHRRLGDDPVTRGFLSPTKLPLAGERISLYQHRGSKLSEVWRQTSVHYATLYPVLIPTYVFVEMIPDVGLLREKKQAGAASVPRLKDFLESQLRVDLSASH